jgi:uncharacterized coiled-coil protein SlyX
MQASQAARKRRRRPSNRFEGVAEIDIGSLNDFKLELEDLQQDICKVNTHNTSSETKIELLSAVVAKQHKVLYSMNDSFSVLTKRLMNNEVVILNLRECNFNDLAKAVMFTFNSIGYQEEIDIETLYRRGPPRDDVDAAPRPVIVRLHRSDVAEKIIKLAKGKAQPHNKKALRILPNLPEKFRQQRTKLGTILLIAII